jgi:hypothetical protein
MTDGPLNEKPLHEWTNRALADRERSYPAGRDPNYGPTVMAEIERRRARSNQLFTFYGLVFTAISAFGSMVAAIASLLVALHYPK